MYNGQLKKRSKSNIKPNKSLKQITSEVRKKLNLKYNKDESFYNKQMIDHIVFNEKSHIFVCFREFIIYEEESEFLRRYYKLSESYDRLPRYFEYYEKCSKIFPNYTALYESKYIYKNIQRKQKLINLQQKLEIEMLNKKNEADEKRDDNVFNTEVYNSIMNVTCGKEREILNMFINEDKELNGLKSSVCSIENILETIDKAEKSSGMKRNKPPVSYKAKSNGIEVIKRFLSPDDKKIAINRPIVNSSSIPKPIENKIPIDTTKKTAYKSNHFINKFLKDHNDKNIEANILSMKFKQIKQRSRISSDLTSATHSKSKVNGVLGNTSTLSKERKRSGSKFDEKPPESSRVQSVINKEDPKKEGSDKNIFYIINQNPQLNTHITIYNEAVNKNTALSNSASKSKSKMTSMTPRGESYSTKTKGDDILIKQVKEQITKAVGHVKKSSAIISSIKAPSHTKTRSVISSCLSGNTGVTCPESSRQTSKNKKEEPLRASVPNFTARNLTRTSSVVKSELITLNIDDNFNLLDRLSLKNITPMNKNLVTSTRVKENNYLKPSNKVISSSRNSLGMKNNPLANSLNSNFPIRSSVSPVNRLMTNDAPQLQKTQTVTNIKSTFTSFKRKNKPSIQIQTPNEEFSSRRTSGVYTAKMSPVITTGNKTSKGNKGLTIKNFNEVMTTKNNLLISSGAVSERLRKKYDLLKYK